MPSSPYARLGLVAAIAASALLLTSCATPGDTDGAPGQSGDAATSTPLPSSGNESPVPTAEATPVAPEDVTCENLVAADIVAGIEAQGWTYREEPFVVGDMAFDDGLSCAWADYSTATSNIVIFGWTPATADQISEVQNSLEASGWLREEEAGSLFITEDPSQAMTTDDNNYGMTYQFGEDWITVSETKQNLLLIEVPGV